MRCIYGSGFSIPDAQDISFRAGNNTGTASNTRVRVYNRMKGNRFKQSFLLRLFYLFFNNPGIFLKSSQIKEDDSKA
jgi:hypothetical protein